MNITLHDYYEIVTARARTLELLNTLNLFMLQKIKPLYHRNV